MKVPRAIALPIVLTVGTLAGLTALPFWQWSMAELWALNLLAKSTRDVLPSLTEFYSKWFGAIFLLPIATWIVDSTLVRPIECKLTGLTWFVCLSVVAMVMVSLYCYYSIYVGFHRFRA